MQRSCEQRVVFEGRFIVENNATVRQTAREFGVSKSTVHKDMQVRLKYYSESLYIEVQKVLKNNFEQKHLRGGIATKNKYLSLKNTSEKRLQNNFSSGIIISNSINKADKNLKKYLIGIDLGGTFIKGGIISDKGKLIVKDQIPTQVERGAEIVAKNIANLCEKLLADKAINKSEVKGIGIGAPGLIDSKNGVVVFAGNLGFSYTPLAQLVQAFASIPVKITNDANAAALGEAKFGAGKGFSDSVFVTLGTGVGGGIVINNQLFEGNKSAGAEIGHMIIQEGGEHCTCGQRGCFEAYSSATALIRETKRAMENNKDSLMWEVGIENVTGKTAFDYASKDETAKTVIDNYIKMLSVGLVNIANIFRPEAIILGGGISRQQGIENPLHELVNKNKFAGTMGPEVKVVVASLKNDAGTFGAAALWL